jgi:hypothetical protein
LGIPETRTTHQPNYIHQIDARLATLAEQVTGSRAKVT